MAKVTLKTRFFLMLRRSLTAVGQLIDSLERTAPKQICPKCHCITDRFGCGCEYGIGS